MRSVDLVVQALTLGALGKQKYATQDGVKQAYTKLKLFLDENYPGVKVEHLEESPQTKGLQFLLKDDLLNTGADTDEALIDLANNLIEQVKVENPELAQQLEFELS